MKIKMDFVSNSSSTSFVYIAREMLSKEEFMAAVGVAADSPLAPLFAQMFYQLQERIERGTTVTSIDGVPGNNGGERYTEAVIDRIKSALAEGKQVIIGSFSSEENLAETMLCTEIFEIETEDFFINAYENYW